MERIWQGLASRSEESQHQSLWWQRGSTTSRLTWKARPHLCLVEELGLPSAWWYRENSSSSSCSALTLHLTGFWEPHWVLNL